MPDAVLTRREPLRSPPLGPTTLNRETRTVRVTASTGAPVQRSDWDGPFIEILSLDPGHVRLDTLRGVPVLDAHRNDSLSDVLGVVTEAGLDAGGLWVDLKVSTRRADLLDDIEDGIARSVSVGYRVHEWQEVRDGDTRTKTATRWEPVEVSFVPLPADPGATTRSKPDMPDDVLTPDAPALDRVAVNAEIRSIATTTGLGADFANGLIDRGATADQARKAAFDALKERSTAPIRTEGRVTMGTSHDDPTVRAAWMGEALFTRVDPAHQPSEAARAYTGLTLPELGREILRLRGVPTTGLSPEGVITRALHTTSDFSILLGDTVGRTLRQAYGAAPAGVRRLGRQTTARDFRAKHRVQLSEAPTLEKVNEHGEFKSGTLSEARESYKVDTFGRIIGISRQALVNDDLGAFADLSRRLGEAAAEFENQFLVDLLTGNDGAGPILSDGQAMFHSDRGNAVNEAALTLDVPVLSAARLALRRRPGLAGMPINLEPRYLLVPASRETEAEKALSQITAATVGDVNPLAGKLTVIVDSRLDDKSPVRWYMVADPATIDGLEYAYLEGAPGPQIESRNGFEIDGVQVKIRLDFGAGFVDWRGWHQVGAA